MRHHILASIVIAGGLLNGGAAAAQLPPPIPGATGAIVPEGATGEGVHTIISGTVDGIRHLFRRPKKTPAATGPESAEPASTDVMADFKDGTPVVVHYPPNGDAEAHEMSGVVTRADRDANAIHIRLSDGTEEALCLLSDSATDGDGAESDATVYYTDQNGRHVAHYFSRR
jgi:hypothetical protein